MKLCVNEFPYEHIETQYDLDKVILEDEDGLRMSVTEYLKVTTKMLQFLETKVDQLEKKLSQNDKLG